MHTKISRYTLITVICVMFCGIAYASPLSDLGNWISSFTEATDKEVADASVNWSDTQTITKYSSEDAFIEKQQDSFGKDVTYKDKKNGIKFSTKFYKENTNDEKLKPISGVVAD